MMTKSFIQISDSHIDDDKLVMGVDSQANLDAIVNMISNQNYDVLLISGDLAHNGTLESYQKLRKILNPIETKIYVLPGNHDDFSNLSQIFNQSSLCNFSIGCWEIITIDSVQVGKADLRISKHRNGATGNIKLAFIGQYARFEDLAFEDRFQNVTDDEIDKSYVNNMTNFDQDNF